MKIFLNAEWSQLTTNALKLLFYAYLHPWSELIRNPEMEGTSGAGADVTNIFDKSKLNEEFKKQHTCEYF